MEGPRALFDRARVHLLKERILLPGIGVLVRLVGEVRRAENERVHALLSGWLSQDMQQALEKLLAVPDGKRRSRSWNGCASRRPRPRVECWPRSSSE
ncbi:hypothetical protein ACQPYK_23890 [Streptosporangium sp. CA-135522]|uniref:hypothetical protein n=1 Tax=Streptosporangium sp. CA-135522 TaxID=3240072 RepID=UPI003D91C86D